MARARLSFKERDVARALRAAQKSGVPMQRVEIDRDGRIIMIPCEPYGPSTHDRNECDENDHAA
jgi:hypothetical protein